MIMSSQPSILDEAWVVIDLETTGLSADQDMIIEVGAIKFHGEHKVDTFETLVNPGRQLTDFVKRLTGITQNEVNSADPFSAIAGPLAEFVGSSPVLGHNLSFDLDFLRSNGVTLTNTRCDTWDMAFVLMPSAQGYSLSQLAASLEIDHLRPHRAISDASATHGVFLKLLALASELDIASLGEMEQLATRSQWVLADLFRSLMARRVAEAIQGPSGSLEAQQSTPRDHITVGGLDISSLKERLCHQSPLQPNDIKNSVDAEQVAALLRDGGPLANILPGFEERGEQITMARAVVEALNRSDRLIVEAGTGVGKSLAYLLPAALHALKNNKRVVVSTNTINLQEQLVAKDIPALITAIDVAEPGLGKNFRYTQLKGRANFLCLKRQLILQASESLSVDEARLLSKNLVWLRHTKTGDRSELNFSNRRAGQPWDRLSAEGAPNCTGVNGGCFLRHAREKAAASHLIVVNHALLMSDIMAGGTLIPDYDLLIVDEAHHLEDEATKHLGFDVSQAGIDEYMDSLTGERGLLNQIVSSIRMSSAASNRKAIVQEATDRIMGVIPDVRDASAAMFATIDGLTRDGEVGGEREQEIRITAGTRSQPGWSQVEILWQNTDVTLGELRSEMNALYISLDGLGKANVSGYEGLVMETTNRLQVVGDIRQRLNEFVPHPQSDGIYWVTRDRRTGTMSLHVAPLRIGERLADLLFSEKEAVVLTSATLATNGTFKHIRDRTGFADTEELLLGSPFNYPEVAMLGVPEDMPEPASWAYQAAVEQAVMDAVMASGGSTMALFTSHASLRTTATGIRSNLQAHGINVLAQGVDGPPNRLVQRFVKDSKSILLGTASFWEGVDLPGDILKVLLLARLPFSVPTAPVFAARSEEFDTPFTEYAIPQAILRVRQGFGRLIRTKTDRGAVIILDRRIISRNYGKIFLDSLPNTTFKTFKLCDLAENLRIWLR